MQALPFIPRTLGPLPGPDPIGLLATSRRTVEQLRGLCELRLPSTALRAHALELAILAGHLLLYPSGLTDERPAPPAAGSPPRPVIMLHGFADNRSVFVLLRRSLARHGWRDLQCLNYSPLTCDIRAAARLLGRHVEEVCARSGRDGVDLVGHSLGGLIARYYSQCLGGDLWVRNVVTLGTPHSGTRVAPLASAHPIVRQMRPDSPVIEELCRPAPGCRTRFTSFWSELDQWMDPVETALIDHADLRTENVRVTGIGHLALPVHPAVAARIREVLGAAEDAPGPGSAAGEPVAVA
ncbi:esterase/lipase family protein [Streptomyces sp. NPDC094448]|uniref:esterase/lipase family protein n=1 Tax=Streptomyces sp. NPDC094448 TaxID=3366063 RepID=UPI003802C8F0